MLPHHLDAILGAYQGDPFSVLGPHKVEREDGAIVWEVRAFLPHAAAVSVVNDMDSWPMERVHKEGAFEVTLPVAPGLYRLRLALADGSTHDIEDPFRFPPLLTSFDLHLHGEGTQYESYGTMGSHFVEVEGVAGVRFAVWAPNAQAVSVSGDFNGWDPRVHPMRRREGGIWELFLPGVQVGQAYKYFVCSQFAGVRELKADPYAFYAEVPPKQASIVWKLDGYSWNDGNWMEDRARKSLLDRPVSVYEVHLESWMKGPEDHLLSYRDLAVKLVPYAKSMGFTHLELMPPMEHPYAGSWGYQVTGFYAPTSRFGTPQDFMFFIDQCHQHGIGVIIDWVPAHFPKDMHGLARFDGTACYEHADPRQGEQKEWGTFVFNFGRNEVRTFLISNALFWLKQYHIDGLRVDAVASMLYLDYSREGGDWIPNKYGGRENIDAIEFLRRFNEEAHKVPGAVTIAEESTSFAGVSHPVYTGGLGFTMKWNMGWMHDMFRYFKTDPVYRKFSHNEITFSLLYAFTENFLLPISHDEVVHGKGSLIGKMPGDEWKRFAGVRAFLAYMWGHPGKKLLFMGCEIGQYEEWNWQAQIRWELLTFAYHRKLQTFVRELNQLYQSSPALYEVDYNWTGFEWVDFKDVENSVISFIRRAKDPGDYQLWVCNFTPVPRHNYNVGVPERCWYEEVLNSDWEHYGGSGVHNGGRVMAWDGQTHGRPHGICITLPPLGVTVFRPVRQRDETPYA
jgi:1,4-alpha-glucan branching enzyme